MSEGGGGGVEGDGAGGPNAGVYRVRLVGGGALFARQSPRAPLDDHGRVGAAGGGSLEV